MTDAYDAAVANPSEWIDGRPGLREAMTRWNAAPRGGDELVGALGRPGIGLVGSMVRRSLTMPSVTSRLLSRTPPGHGSIRAILGSIRSGLLDVGDGADAIRPAMTPRVVRQRIGPAAWERLTDLDDRPVSVSEYDQVHRGMLTDGTPVAVAVSRPGVDRLIRDDASLLGPWLIAAEILDPSPWRDGLVEILQDVAASGLRRCDQRAVALDAGVLQAALTRSGIADVTIAQPIPELVGRNFAVYTPPAGEPMTSHPSSSDLLGAGVATIVETGLVHGVYSTHLHRDYVWSNQHGTTTLVGGTSVGQVRTTTRGALAEMVMGVGNARTTADALVSMGVLPPFVDRDQLADGLTAGGLANPLALLGADGVSQLKAAGRALVVEHGARATPELTGLALAVLRLQAAVRQGDPHRPDLLRVLPRLAGIGSRMTAAA